MTHSSRSHAQATAWLGASSLLLAALIAEPLLGGGLIRGGAVGGVLINTDGLVSNPEEGDLRQIQAAWQAELEEIPGELDAFTELRFVSLKRLEAEIANRRRELLPLPDAVTYLSGLQRVRYVLVYPDQQDIVLAGPAEGWRVDSLGNVVGATTQRPVLMLDDLIIALRTGESSRLTGISCSIDPTPEGIQRMRQVAGQLVPGMSPQVAARRIEEALGRQTVTVTGVPTTSHFARVLLAADFRMKRLAMNFEPAPVDRMPSYLELASGGRGVWTMLPRWWLAPNYEPLLRDEGGLAWELRGKGVRCMTEQDLITDEGQREQTGRVDKMAKRWADTMTERFEELAHEDSAFGHVRNIMDLAVVGALIAKERLLDRAGLTVPHLMEKELLDRYSAPQHVASQASFVKKRGAWLISASGGVQVFPWQVADKTATDDGLEAEREKAMSGEHDRWWWQGGQTQDR